MKNVSILALFQALSSVISGILISKMSFIGRVGINMMHREYLIFKTWWKTALLFFVTQLVLILILEILRKISPKFQKIISFLLVIIGGVGAYLTYIDFTTTSHKMMKMSFHSGFYLFWVSWFITCFYYLFQRFPQKHKKETIIQPLNNPQENSVKD